MNKVDKPIWKRPRLLLYLEQEVIDDLREFCQANSFKINDFVNELIRRTINKRSYHETE